MKSILLNIFLCFALFYANAQNASDTLNKLDNNGKKHGYWKKISGSNALYEGKFYHGTPVGTFKYYYPDKTIKSILQYSSNGEIADAIFFYGNGSKMSEGKYINQKKEGLWKDFDGYDNVLAEIEYKNGEKWGKSTKYYSSGGALEKANYRNGWLDGEYILYYEKNITKTKGFYQNTLENGTFYFYYPSGALQMTGKYKDGLRDGEWRIVDEFGKLIVREQFQKGQVLWREVLQKDKDPVEIARKNDELEQKNKGKTEQSNDIQNNRFMEFYNQ